MKLPKIVLIALVFLLVIPILPTSFAQTAGAVKQTLGNNEMQLYVEEVKTTQSSTVKTVEVSVIFKNLDFKPQLFNLFYMKLKDSDGREYSPEFGSKLPSAYIPSSDIARGILMFEIPASATPARFSYSSFLQSGIVVDLTQTNSTADAPPPL